jgi:hypothetical protein
MSHLNHPESAGVDSPRSRGLCAGFEDSRVVFSIRAPMVPPVRHPLWTAGGMMVLAGEVVQLCAFAQPDAPRRDSSLGLDRY